MRICIYSDPHWSQYSSILRKRGQKFSLRLENQIQSLNWVFNLAREQNCMFTICLGDFFDKAELCAEEISALKEVDWAPMSNYFIAGNHEMGIADHSYSSAKIFDLLDTGTVLTTPSVLSFKDGAEICILPYILENNRKPLNEYFPDRVGRKRIILSHNDIAGIQMGGFVSNIGFPIEEIEANCDLFINGHLHNGERVTDKIINIGNLTGQNFGEDAFRYDHTAFILDTETLKIEVYENPCALNFYKIDMTQSLLPSLKDLKSNAVVVIKVPEADASLYRNILSENPNVLEYRLITQADIVDEKEIKQEELMVDHLSAFRTYMLENVDNTTELIEELTEILK